ncbi:MAG: hypothetical protein R6U78_16805 [Bacteroidales bacterium]
MANISSHQQSGITREELKEAVPESLSSKNIYLHWIDKSPSGKDVYTLTAKIDIDGQTLLLRSKTSDAVLIEGWDVTDPSYHTNARLVALERILTDPANEDILLSL